MAPEKAVYLLVVEGFADWEPAHAVAELRLVRRARTPRRRPRRVIATVAAQIAVLASFQVMLASVGSSLNNVIHVNVTAVTSE